MDQWNGTVEGIGLLLRDKMGEVSEDIAISSTPSVPFCPIYTNRLKRVVSPP
jgi:hypothetical protein